MTDIGKIVIIIGLLIVVVGVIMSLGLKIPFIGKLPGDIYIKRDGFSLYFPLATSILLSIILTIVFRLFNR